MFVGDPRRATSELRADVLVLGGGPAGAWAAIEAAEAGATVVLADKGRVGTSGATAAANTAVIDVEADTPEHRAVMERRLERGLGLAQTDWIERALYDARRRLSRLADWGYRFPTDDRGQLYRGTLRGPDYMQLLRRRLSKLRVQLLDHCPATHLLRDEADGLVAGACGLDRRTYEPWRVSAGAVVVATGGCAFMSRALGTFGLTGDGLLMGAEAGAALSGLEFSGQYGIAHVDATVTKNLIYQWATFTDQAGRVLEGDDKFALLARHLPQGPVFAVIDKADRPTQEGLRRGQPNIFLPLDRQGIDPFRDRFPVTLIYEGTVRGVGGLAVTSQGSTSAAGLYAAGDAASREPLVGAVSGGGGPNSTWAIASGSWAGRAAALFSARLGAAKHARSLRLAGGPPRRWSPDRNRAWIASVQARLFPIDRSFFKEERSLVADFRSLDELWCETRSAEASSGEATDLRSRETEAMIATARFICAAGIARSESRGIHRRRDRPGLDPSQARSLKVHGIDRISTEPAGAWA